LLVKKPRRPKGKGKATAEPAAPEILLFDLSTDPGEQTNLASSHSDLVADLTKRMLELDAEIETNARAPWVKGEE
jgi:hypothetical protein